MPTKRTQKQRAATRKTPAKAERETWTDLAGKLRVSDRSLRSWRSRPNAPQTPDAADWQAFIEEQGLGRAHSGELADLKRQVEREKLRRLRRENEVAEGQVITRQAVDDFLKAWTAKLDMLLTSELEHRLPPLVVGKPIAEIRVAARDCHDRLRDATHRGLVTGIPDADLEN